MAGCEREFIGGLASAAATGPTQCRPTDSGRPAGAGDVPAEQGAQLAMLEDEAGDGVLVQLQQHLQAADGRWQEDANVS
jgi:hypothetical protein